ncbi:hypothetical protein [Clostridioides difficile]|uniref:hypothetical protein n=1 Tax=Clostridioides difficile TaxID=1496 RepID=UPI000235ADFB|nr:hypothetical protein [Clostridioides difficile]EHJ34336.1 hypothetical protein HMPREF1122_00313 [Clostridioides difficile 002-P50-2011]EQK36419.1 hypothetical protein QW3_3877 [Clostridioides difficile P74]MBH7440896.1 hypothetical protein [Clostridioides difficile]MBS1276198.1 hypothetical protein [Clostridioides difficile]MBY2495197.1 hypothetical protein [Clostridioides difficile]
MLIEVTENNRELKVGDIVEINGGNKLYMILSLKETIGGYVIINMQNGYGSFGAYKSLSQLELDLKARGYKLYSSDDYKLQLVPRE